MGTSCHGRCGYAFQKQADFGQSEVPMQVLDDTRVQPRHYKYAIDIAASAMNQADPGARSLGTIVYHGEDIEFLEFAALQPFGCMPCYAPVCCTVTLGLWPDRWANTLVHHPSRVPPRAANMRDR